MRFSKWHGLGNDYLVVDRADAVSPLAPALVRRLCDYHTGVGADGVLEILSVAGSRAEVVIWNPDGSTAELSGNGTRIAARWLALRTRSSRVVVAVGGREVVATLTVGTTVEQELGPVRVDPDETITVGTEQVTFTPVSVGNPHAVIRREPEHAELLRLGPLVETHERFPERTNVQLARVDGRHELTVAVWERGAGETRSSGTSACAVAAAAVARGWCESPITVRLPGGELAVAIDARWHATLTGPAEEICTGELSSEWLERSAG
jgi:diaminopimelate epimerase